MFSTERLIFIAFFVVVFIALLYFSYKKDAPLHRKEYKGARWVLFGFVGFVLLLFLIKFLLRWVS